MKKNLKKIIILTVLISVLVVFSVNIYVVNKSKAFIYKHTETTPRCYTAIVLGALVSKTEYLSNYLHDRMVVSIELYKTKKIKRFLLSGDHGRKDYDEVNTMKNYLLDRGVNTEDIFLDHAGFNTYSTMCRAKDVFDVTDALIITQDFHLSRAVYIAREKGLKAYGVSADRRNYGWILKLQVRETLANVKAFVDVTINKRPRFLGSKIPITGDSKLSYD